MALAPVNANLHSNRLYTRGDYPPVDIVTPDAHSGYDRNESVEDRINVDIVLPARKTGDRKIWAHRDSLEPLLKADMTTSTGHR